MQHASTSLACNIPEKNVLTSHGGSGEDNRRMEKVDMNERTKECWRTAHEGPNFISPSTI